MLLVDAILIEVGPSFQVSPYCKGTGSANSAAKFANINAAKPRVGLEKELERTLQ